MKFSLLLILLIPLLNFAQELSVSGQFRPRFEYKDYLSGHEVFKPIFIGTQRSRLTIDYKNPDNHFQTRVTIQDARVYGNLDQLANGDQNSLGLFEAWSEIFFTKKTSVRIGRQHMFFDDSKILGRSDFPQTGRSHDAVLFKYNGKTKISISGAYNQNTTKVTESFEPEYTLNNYKTMQLLHIKRHWKKIEISGLFFNNGHEYKDPNTTNAQSELLFNQSIGLNFLWKISNNLGFRTSYYHQSGLDQKKRKLNANSLKGTLELWAIPKKLQLIGGLDYYSGNPFNATANENRSFTPIYGSTLINMGMAAIYLVPFSQGKFSYNYGINKALLETKLILGKFILWNRFYVYNSEYTFYDTSNLALEKYLGLEEELFIIYKQNKFITYQAIAGLFNMSSNIKKGLSHPSLGSYSNFRNWQSWFIFEVSIRPSFFYKKWDKK